jgi:hypothetical protein
LAQGRADRGGSKIGRSTLILRGKDVGTRSTGSRKQRRDFRICIIIIHHHIYKSTLGLGSGSKCIYQSKSLTPDQLLKIVKDRRDRNVGASNNGNIRMPEIDVDANQVAFKWIKNTVSAAATLFKLCKLFSKLGANINVIVDPPTRHHTKRETTRRKGNAERARLK